MALSKNSLLFLQDLLNRTQIAVGAPGWRNTASLTAIAQDELAREVARFDEHPTPADGQGVGGEPGDLLEDLRASAATEDRPLG